MEFLDIRQGSDLEFGQSIYEPFGIAQVEISNFAQLNERLTSLSDALIELRDGKGLDFPISMAFQPIVDVARRQVFAHEALVRGVNGESAGACDLGRVLRELQGTQTVHEEDHDVARCPTGRPQHRIEELGGRWWAGHPQQRGRRRQQVCQLRGCHCAFWLIAAERAAANSRVRTTAPAPSPASETRTEKSSLEAAPAKP